MSTPTITIDPTTVTKFSDPTSESANTLQQSMSYGTTQNPDNYAKLLELEKRTGIRPITAQGNEKEIEQQAAANGINYHQFAVSHPRTTAWLSNPDNAAVAHDDLGNLSTVERLRLAVGNAIPESIPMPTEMGTVDIPTTNILAFAKKILVDPFESASAWGAEKAGRAAEYLAAGLSENAVPGVPFNQKPSRSISEFEQQQPIAAGVSKGIGGTIGGMATDPRMWPFFLSGGGAVRAGLQKLTTAGFAAQMSTGTATSAYDTIQNWSQMNEMQKAEAVTTTGLSAYFTAHSLSHLAHIKEIGNVVDESKLMKRSPEKMHEALSEIFAGDEPVRIPVEQFDTYFQSQNVDPAAIAQQLGVSNYAEARLAGTEVEIPNADFLTKLDAEHRNGLSEDIINPKTGVSARQSQELQQWEQGGGWERLKQEMDSADAEAVKTAQEHPEFAPIRDEISGRLQSGFGMKKAEADTHATAFAMQYMNAERAGMSPLEYFQARNPVVRMGEAPEAGLSQSAMQAAESLRPYAQKVIQDGAIKSVDLIGSTASKGSGNDVDLLYDFGTVGLPKDEAGAVEKLTELIESSQIDTESHDSFFKVDGRYFHLSSGAGRDLVENTDYAIEQAGKPRITLAGNGQSEPIRLDFDKQGNVVDGDGRHRIIAALERGDETIPIQVTMRDGTVENLNVSPVMAAEKLGVTPESLRATDEQQNAFLNQDVLYQSTREPATFNGKPFFTGAVNPLDGQIEAVVDHGQAANFRHRGYFPPELADRIDRGELATFVVHDGKVSLHRTANEGMAEAGLLKAIESQIQVMPQTLYQPKQETPEGANDFPTYITQQIEKERYEPAVKAAKEAGLRVVRDYSELPPPAPGTTRIYHGTRPENLRGIAERGLLPGSQTGIGDGTPSVLGTTYPQMPPKVDVHNTSDAYYGRPSVVVADVPGVHDGREASLLRIRPEEIKAVYVPKTNPEWDTITNAEIERWRKAYSQSDTTLPPSTDGAMHQGADNPRGWFRILPDGSFEIGKTPFGDKSTPVHEGLGHPAYFLLRDLASREGASEQLKSDLATVHDWLGVKEGQEPNREQMEQWARAVEMYFTKGEAPTSGLRKVFQRIAVWMSSVYKAAKQQLGVEIPPQISDVMDRWFAASDVVEKVAKERIDSVDQKGWTPEQVQKYAEAKGMEVEEAKAEIVAKFNEAAMRERTDYWREEEKNVREAVTQEIDAKPEYAAIRALRKGELDNGDTIAINREALVKQFGEERIKQLQKLHPNLYRAEGGVDPEVAAEIFGFDSADHLLTALENVPRRTMAIEQATRDYMTRKYGDIRYDGTLEDQARLALENDRRAQNLHKELTQLRKQVADLKEKETGRKEELRAIQIAPLSAYRDAAAEMVESKAVADLQPTRYLDASRKYSREAFDDLRKDDIDSAIQAKHKELLNHFLYREASKAQDRVKQIELYAKRTGQVKELGKLGLAGNGFLEQSIALRERYGFRTAKSLSEPRQETLAQFVTRLHDEEIYNLPIDPVLLDESRPERNYRSVPMSELDSVYRAMRGIEKAAKMINSVSAEGKRIAIDNAAEQLKTKLFESLGEPKTLKNSDSARSFVEKFSSFTPDIGIVRPEFIFERWDGYKKQGPWHEFLGDRFNDAQDHRNRLFEKLWPMIEANREAKIDRSQKFYIRSMDVNLTKDDIISIALNSGNESNLDKQMRGGLQFENDQKPRPISYESLMEILSHLTPEEIALINQTWRTVELLKPDAAELSRRRSGMEPKWIEAKPLQVKNGTLEGGYWPVAYDHRFSAAGEKQVDSSLPVEKMFTQYATANTKQGYLIERTGFVAPLKLDWQSVMSRHLNDVVTDISHWEFASDAQRLLKHPEVKTAVISRMGDMYYRNLLNWVKYTVKQDSMGPETSDTFERYRRAARSKVSTAVLGLKVGNAIAETAITPILAAQHVTPESSLRGVMTYLRNPVEATRFATEASDYMRHLDTEIDRNVNEAISDLRGQHSLIADIRKFSIGVRVAIWKIGAVMAWHAGYIDAMSRGIEGKAAVREADSIYRMTQEAGRPGDLSASERSSWLRELTMFIGPSLIQYNNLRRSVMMVKDQGLTKRTVAMGLTTLLAGHITNAVLFNILRGKGPDKQEDIPKWLAARLTLGLFEGVPFFRDVAGYAEGRILHEPGKNIRPTPVQQMGQDTYDALEKTGSAAFGSGKWEPALKQDARAVGAWTGLPASQVNITGEYIYDVLTGQYKPAHPWSPVTDIFYTRKQKH